MKIQPPHPAEVENISFFAAPPFAPNDTAYDMLVYLMEQPWSNISRANGNVVVADLRSGGGGGQVVAVYRPKVGTAARGADTQPEPAKILQFPSKRGALVP